MNPHDTLIGALSAAHGAVAAIRQRPDTPKEAHRALSLVVTKLDEARLWHDEALGLIEDAEVAREAEAR